MTVHNEILPQSYSIELHQHRFAAWAASRAASVNTCRFKVQQGRAILEACGFCASLCRPEQLPTPHAIDEEHRGWRVDIVAAASAQGLRFTHGIAAKLINVYLKGRFVCAGCHAHERVQSLHPPIDRVLLSTLVEQNVGGHVVAWQRAAHKGWSNFASEDYEQVIALIRQSLHGHPLWMIEEHWRGNI